MRKLISIIMIFSFIFITNHEVKSQTLGETLSNLSSSAGSAYVKPIISAFGSNLNSAWVSGAPPAAKFKFTIGLKFVLLGSIFPDEHKTLDAVGNFRYTADQVDAILLNSGYCR